MAQVRVHSYSVSLDGYAAGPDQSLDSPLGVGGEELHTWFTGGDRTELDQRFVDRMFENIGAIVMGRNMYGPVRGPWESWGEEWTGWWGPNPPYHAPVFVLTHYAHDPIEMEGGTTFYFVDEPVEAAVERAKEAAGGKDVQIAGGASVVRAALRVGLIDDLHIAVSPILLGSGERIFDDTIGIPAGYEFTEFVASPRAAHYRLTKPT
jgi:dihydrofolate reductase